jgi:DNA replication protein DnaC
MELRRQNEQRARALRQALLPLLGGEKPYREFTFDQYEVTSENRRAFEKALHFNCLADNLYLWGPCGVGKTHLAWAVGRACFEETLSLSILPAAQLTRKVRMKDPMQEQAIIDEWVLAKVLVLDDLGNGPDTLFTRQIVQEILDRRSFRDIGGLVVTTKFSLDQLAAKLGDDSIPSRLGGMCDVIEVQGKDRRCA